MEEGLGDTKNKKEGEKKKPYLSQHHQNLKLEGSKRPIQLSCVTSMLIDDDAISISSSLATPSLNAMHEGCCCL